MKIAGVFYITDLRTVYFKIAGSYEHPESGFLSSLHQYFQLRELFPVFPCRLFFKTAASAVNIRLPGKTGCPAIHSSWIFCYPYLLFCHLQSIASAGQRKDISDGQ